MTTSAAVLPAYNEAAHVTEVIEQVEATELVDHVIVIDDCSTDDTAARVAETGAILLSNNSTRNYGGAIKRGYDHALKLGVDYIYRLDTDGQHDPDELSRFWKELRQPDCQYVLGNRFGNRSVPQSMPLDRLIGNRVVALATSLRVGNRINDPPCGYRAMDTEYLSRIPYEKFSNDFQISVEEILAFGELGAGIKEVPVSCIYENEASTLTYYDGIKFLLPNLRW